MKIRTRLCVLSLVLTATIGAADAQNGNPGLLPAGEFTVDIAPFSAIISDTSNLQNNIVTIKLKEPTGTTSDLRRAKPNLFVVYFMHVLQNYSWKTSDQAKTAAALRKAGVDLVIGAGAHMLQQAECDDGQWTFYGLGDFIFNAGGRYSTLHASPYSTPLVIDFSLEHGRLRSSLRLYPIVSGNNATNYQPRFVSDRELSTVISLLAQEGHWPLALRTAVMPGTDRIAKEIIFSRASTSISSECYFDTRMR